MQWIKPISDSNSGIVCTEFVSWDIIHVLCAAKMCKVLKTRLYSVSTEGTGVGEKLFARQAVSKCIAAKG